MRRPTRKQVKAANKAYWEQTGKPLSKKKQATPNRTGQQQIDAAMRGAK